MIRDITIIFGWGLLAAGLYFALSWMGVAILGAATIALGLFAMGDET